MKLLFIVDRFERYKLDIYLINLLILSYVFRVIIPALKYPFIALFGFYFFYIIINRKDKVKDSLKIFIKNYAIIILLVIILCLALIFSYKISLLVFKDILNAIILLSFFFFLNILIDSKKELSFLITNLIHFIILIAVIISFHDLLILFNVYNLAFEDSTKIDYNFALLPVFFGIVGSFYILVNTELKSIRAFINFILIILFFNIILSSSRRGIILLLIILLIIIFTQIFTLFRNRGFLIKIAQNSKVFLIIITLLTITLYAFIFQTTSHFKNTCLELLGSKDVFKAKHQISRRIYRSTLFSNKSATYVEMYNIMWGRNFDPRYPQSGWGYNNCKRVSPLWGNNVEIVPKNAYGCLMDSSCYDSYDLKNQDRSAYSIIDKIEVKKGERYHANVYCFVSNDFDGESVYFSVKWSTVAHKIVSINSHIVNYDMKRKGYWQKLEMKFDCCKDGIVPIYINICKNKEKDFSNLKGYVIFAYPEYKKIGLSDCNLSYLEENKLFNLNIYNNNLLPNCRIRSESLISNISKIPIQARTFSLIFSDIANQAIILNDKDPIRSWVAKFISEDTSYYHYKKDLLIDTVYSNFTGARLNRWRFAYQIFTKEYNWTKKIFGGGFDHLNWYGYYFYNDKTRSDWPHNPFLSVLLYSGILGLTLYLFVFYKAVYYYIKYIKECYIFFIFFLITFFFSFFSADSPFNPPVMGFLLIFPFFLHSVLKRENIGKKDEKE